MVTTFLIKQHYCAKNEIDVENLRNSTLQEVATIPPENIQEPPLKILGPALEASKYYIEEEELRSMFAKILSSSFDNRKKLGYTSIFR